MIDCISFDFDSTLSNSQHRKGFIDREKGTDWEAYSMLGRHDTPGPAYALAKEFSLSRYPWIIVTGRSECAREVSLEWLAEYNLNPLEIFMCDERHEYMSHGEWKALRLEDARVTGYNVRLHIDDIKDVKETVEAKLDIPVMLVHDLWTPVEDHLG